MAYVPDTQRRSYSNIEIEKRGVPRIPTRKKVVVQSMELGTNRKKQNAAVAAGKCYICLENQATLPDGIGGMLCPQCLEAARQIMLKHALSQAGYHRKSRK